ncbi:MAG: translesion DNA synthesis-associated protein ImuA [Gammaproteobacteria bacterium]|jgi:cell division inhibitor SulA/protein ImuA|nr:translesion DNA synthesis-associated protein ImuA [Gammaproteobacteria bacterium]
MTGSLEGLLRHPDLWRGHDRLVAPAAVVPAGWPDLDGALPGGGWPQGALVELLSGRSGIGEVSLLLPALAHLAREGRPSAWIAPPHVPYAPALAGSGLDLARLVVVQAEAREALWAAEQALRSGLCGAVLAWPRESSLDERALRRLQLAAEEGRSLAILFRSDRCAGVPSPARLRLLLEPAGQGLAVRLLKCRGRGPSGPFLVPHE